MIKLFRKQTQVYSDLELVAKFKASGDMQLLGQLYEPYMELVYGVCLKILKDQAAAEDAVMNIFEELIRKVPKHDIGNFKSWLHVLSKNHCLMALRKNGKMKMQALSPELMQLQDQLHPIFEGEDNGQLENLGPCLQALKEKQKQCIELFYYQGKSYQEIASLIGEEVGRVRSYIQNGRRNLKICMEKKNEKSIRK